MSLISKEKAKHRRHQLGISIVTIAGYDMPIRLRAKQGMRAIPV
jgi:hypothetical protein